MTRDLVPEHHLDRKSFHVKIVHELLQLFLHADYQTLNASQHGRLSPTSLDSRRCHTFPPVSYLLCLQPFDKRIQYTRRRAMDWERHEQDVRWYKGIHSRLQQC